MTEENREILALDVSDRTGWAYSAGTFGTWVLGHPEKSPSHGQRMASLRTWILATFETFPFGLIAMEAPIVFHGHNQGMVYKIQQCGIVHLVADELGVDLVEYAVPTMKAWLTGNGRAKKKDMIRWIDIHFGIRVRDDNQADAICLLEMAKAGVAPMKSQSNRRPRRRSRKIESLF